MGVTCLPKGRPTESRKGQQQCGGQARPLLARSGAAAPATQGRVSRQLQAPPPPDLQAQALLRPRCPEAGMVSDPGLVGPCVHLLCLQPSLGGASPGCFLIVATRRGEPGVCREGGQRGGVGRLCIPALASSSQAYPCLLGSQEKPRLLPLPGFPLPPPGIDFLHHSFARPWRL